MPLARSFLDVIGGTPWPTVGFRLAIHFADLVLFHAAAGGIASAQFVEGRRKTLLGGLAIPANWFVQIPRDAAAFRVQGGQSRLHNRNAPFRGLTIDVFRAATGVAGGAPPATVDIVYCCAKAVPANSRMENLSMRMIIPL